MQTLRTVAAFDTQTDVANTIDTLVNAGIPANAIELILPPEEHGLAEPADEAVESVRLAVTAPQEDTALVEDILRDAGEIDVAASQTPAVGWSGDPDGETLDRTRTPVIGWSGRDARRD